MVLTIGAGGFVAWSMTTKIDGAVVAPGQVAVEVKRQAIQHPDGGMVTVLHVREGDDVAAGSPILTLDETDLVAQRAVARRERIELLAQQDRLLSEIRDQDRVTYRSELQELTAESPEVPGILADETILFEARLATRRQSDSGLAERQVQTEAAISGRERQLQAARKQLDLIADELAAQQKLLAKGLTENSRVSVLRRETARFEGEIGELEAGIAEARSAIAGFAVERTRLKAAFREAAQAELRDLQPREAELRERLRLIDTKIGRLTLRAPMNGRVLGLQANTVGGVINAGVEVASIVPTNVPLVLAVEIDPTQIDRLRPGQDAKIRFPNFNSRTTPEIDGKVKMISADTIAEPQTGRRYFLAELSIPEDADAILGDNHLLPGMPIEAFIRTDARTPASFLLKPLADYWAYAMREE